MTSLECVSAQTVQVADVVAEASSGIATSQSEMQHMRSHIDACYARVAEAAADQANKTGTPDTKLQGLYDAAARDIRYINLKVIARENPSGKTEKQVY